MNDEISLKELLETTFTINENHEMVGTYTLTRINIISNILTNLQQENNNLKTSLDESQEVVIDLQKEIERLEQELQRKDNIINELRKWLSDVCLDPHCCFEYRIILDKVKELEERK